MINSPTPTNAEAAVLEAGPLTAARRLLGAVITARGGSARIVEVEAYGGPADGPWPDAAAHSYRGLTARNSVMFGPPGRLYVYRIYGIHLCANVSCGADGIAGAVLLRAAIVESGHGRARTRRRSVSDTHALARGPGNLCTALAITTADNGVDLFDPASPVTVRFDDADDSPSRQPAGDAVAGPRVGVSSAADRPWRLWLPGRPEVSAYRRSPRAPRPGASD
ncbi:MAG: DNA-3-methyladenine glycosylase [Mycobacterium sp.]|nr:DNA-3-methyladenine glycosylase [Mycobacterium sp.]